MKFTAVSVVLLGLCGCMGSVDDVGDDPGTTPDGTPGGTPGTGPGGVPLGELPLVEDPGPGLAHIRRLTRAELNRTLADLLGDRSNPADALLPDGRVDGYQSNFAAPTTLLDVGKYDELAVALAEGVTPRDLAPCDVAQETTCVETFLRTLGRRVYRRPLTDEETARYTQLFDTKRATGTYGEGIRLVLRGLLQSPHFVYHMYLGEPTAEPSVTALTGYEIAERLSYFLTGSTPSDALLDAAEAGEFDTEAGLASHVDRLLDDPRIQETLAQFHNEWLELEGLESAQKDPTTYAAFTEEVRSAAAEETKRFVWEMYQANGGSLETLLSAPFSYINGDLASVYGVPSVTGATLRRADFAAGERAGLLTQLGFLATHANFGQSSPIFRGVAVRQRLLCQTLPLPPANIEIEEPEVDANASTRERFAAHREDPACSGCHTLIDPIGFGFESFDGIGRFRTEDGGQPVDVSGEVVNGEDASGTFDGAVELAQRLSTSETVRDCAAEQWFSYAVGREDTPSDHGTLGAIRATFADSGHTTRALLRAIALSPPFRFVNSDAR